MYLVTLDENVDQEPDFTLSLEEGQPPPARANSAPPRRQPRWSIVQEFSLHPSCSRTPSAKSISLQPRGAGHTTRPACRAKFCSPRRHCGIAASWPEKKTSQQRLDSTLLQHHALIPALCDVSTYDAQNATFCAGRPSTSLTFHSASCRVESEASAKSDVMMLSCYNTSSARGKKNLFLGCKDPVYVAGAFFVGTHATYHTQSEHKDQDKMMEHKYLLQAITSLNYEVDDINILHCLLGEQHVALRAGRVGGQCHEPVELGLILLALGVLKHDALSRADEALGLRAMFQRGEALAAVAHGQHERVVVVDGLLGRQREWGLLLDVLGQLGQVVELAALGQ
ncbi:hypothetical protein GQ600_19582 [Phytophthora cactorum]|nr:hypothetical protein GQ600_19582 [Phytophthora cactorum]